MSFPYTVGLAYGKEKAVFTDQHHPLGTRGVNPDGRVYYYAQAGEAIGAGKTIMQKAGVANHDMDLVIPSAVAVGAQEITVTLGATAATKDQYKDGLVYINDGAGEGHVYKIKSHPAASSSGDLTLTLYPDDKVREAIDTSALAGLMENPYKDVEIFDADDVDGPCIGVAPTEIANDEFFWAQTWGYAAVLIDTALVLGEPVKVSDATDGAVEPLNRDAVDEDDQVVGVAALISAVTTDYGIVDLHIRV